MKKLLSLVLLITFLHGCYYTPPPESSPRQTFTLTVGVDKEIYRIGEEIVITVWASQECYLTLYDISTLGEVTQIFPNQYDNRNLIQGGYSYRIPDQEDDYVFEIIGPPGMERVRAIGTLDNVNLVDQRKIDATEEFPRIYQDHPGEFDRSVSQKLHSMSADQWTEASITFQVVP